MASLGAGHGIATNKAPIDIALLVEQGPIL